MQFILKFPWKHGLGNQTNATDVNMHPIEVAVVGGLRKHFKCTEWRFPWRGRSVCSKSQTFNLSITIPNISKSFYPTEISLIAWDWIFFSVPALSLSCQDTLKIYSELPHILLQKSIKKRERKFLQRPRNDLCYPPWHIFLHTTRQKQSIEYSANSSNQYDTNHTQGQCRVNCET